MTVRMTKAVLLTAAIALLVGIKVGGQAGSRATTAGALPPASIPTFSTENIGRMAHFYVGGHASASPAIHGRRHVRRVWVPKQVKMPCRSSCFTATARRAQCGSKRLMVVQAGRAYLIDQGYVVYMVDYPARGRSPRAER